MQANLSNMKHVTITQKKLLEGLFLRLDKLHEEADDIFEQEHPWLYNKELEPKIFITPARRQNDLNIEEVMKAIKFEFFLINQEMNKEKVVEQAPIFPIDKGTSVVLV
jgi:hypothetical protein